jgi:hypothetical protein
MDVYTPLGAAVRDPSAIPRIRRSNKEGVKRRYVRGFHSLHPFHSDLVSPSEQSPLLNSDGRRRQSPTFYRKLHALLKAEGEPSWLDSFRWFIFGSWANLLVLLVPVAAASHFLNWDAPLRFGFCFVAIIPLAKVRTTPSPALVSSSVNLFRDFNGSSFLSCSAMPQNRCRCPLDRLLLAC